MEKHALIKQKRDQAKSKRLEKINRRTFPPSIFQLNSIIAPYDIPPDTIEPVDIIPEPIIEQILLIEKQFETVNLLAENCLMSKNPLIENEVLIPDIIIEKPDIINPDIIAQAEEIRKVILLTETIKRFSKKKLII